MSLCSTHIKLGQQLKKKKKPPQITPFIHLYLSNKNFIIYLEFDTTGLSLLPDLKYLKRKRKASRLSNRIVLTKHQADSKQL